MLSAGVLIFPGVEDLVDSVTEIGWSQICRKRMCRFLHPVYSRTADKNSDTLIMMLLWVNDSSSSDILLIRRVPAYVHI